MRPDVLWLGDLSMAETDIVFGLDYICCKGHLSATRALNSCRPELKHDHPLSTVSLSLLLSPSLYCSLSSFPFPLFHSLPLSFPFLLFESDTQSILITFKSKGRQDQMFKSVVSKTAVVPFRFTAWPLHDCTAASTGHISRGSWVAAVFSRRWPCVLQS